MVERNPQSKLFIFIHTSHHHKAFGTFEINNLASLPIVLNYCQKISSELVHRIRIRIIFTYM